MSGMSNQRAGEHPIRSATAQGGGRRLAGVAAATLGSMIMIAAAGCGGIDRAGATPTSGASPTASAPSPRSGAATPGGHPTSDASPASGSPSSSPSGSASTAPSPTAARTKPSRGSIHKTVPSRTVHTSKPVGLRDKDGLFGSNITARIADIRQQYVKAKLPGQLSGASVIFNLVIANGSGRALDLNTTTVTVADAEGDPAPQITSDPATRLPNVLRPGTSATATYVFIVPEKRRNPLDIDVTINADLNVVVFRGDAG